MYLSSIQVGIQSAHAQMELFCKYPASTPEGEQLYTWGMNYKTMICLNAGFNTEMLNIVEFLGHEDNTFPWAAFYESEEAMGGMLTNIAIVLPERIYGTSEYELDHESGWAIASKQLTPYEQELIRMKGKYRMAS